MAKRSYSKTSRGQCRRAINSDGRRTRGEEDMVICSKCKKQSSLWSSYSENERYFCENCWNKLKGIKTEVHPKPYGLGGWLILFQIGLLLGIVANLDLIFLYMGTSNMLLTLSSLLLFLNLFCLLFFYTKSPLFRNTTIIYFVIGSLFSLILLIFYKQFELFSGWIYKSLLPSIIWILYLVYSKRVKNTFVK